MGWVGISVSPSTSTVLFTYWPFVSNVASRDMAWTNLLTPSLSPRGHFPVADHQWGCEHGGTCGDIGGGMNMAHRPCSELSGIMGQKRVHRKLDTPTAWSSLRLTELAAWTRDGAFKLGAIKGSRAISAALLTCSRLRNDASRRFTFSRACCSVAHLARLCSSVGQEYTSKSELS